MCRRYIKSVKKSLTNAISHLDEVHALFVTQPEKDFTRKRKLDFQTLVKTILTMSGSSLNKELLNSFNLLKDIPTVSAFNQQRAKVLPEAFEYLFHTFNNNTPRKKKLYRGYRLIACDGSNLSIATNPNDPETLVKVNQSEVGNRMHLNAFFDLMNRTYEDVIVQSFSEYNEIGACVRMLERSRLPKKTILIADRGYENYNIFAHAIEKGWKFLIRVKDINSNGILSGLHLDIKSDYDQWITLQLTRGQSKSKKNASYKFMPSNQSFDYLPMKSKEDYKITFRIVRFKLSPGTYETVITNLSQTEFTPDELKNLYRMRWGIETSFRELKYAIGLTSFHAKKPQYIKQEIYARLTLYNYCELITTSIVVQPKEKNVYQVNFTYAIYICREYLKEYRNLSSEDIELLIRKQVLPVRPDRKNTRKIKPQSVVSFLYRVA